MTSLTFYFSRLRFYVLVSPRIFPNAHKVTALVNGLRRSSSIASFMCRGADKSLAQPRSKQARKLVRDARDFNNIETRAFIKFVLQGKAPKEIYSILTETLPCFLPGRAKDLSASLYIYCRARCCSVSNFRRLNLKGIHVSYLLNIVFRNDCQGFNNLSYTIHLR